MTAPESLVDARVEQLRAGILRAVRNVCPSWLADEADDLAQIATSRVLARLTAGGAEADFSQAYLRRAAYSVVIDEIRRRRRRPEVPFDPDVEVPSPAGTGDPERQAIGRDIREGIGRCLSGLAPSRRRAVTLHLLGHTMAEIGDLLQCAPKKAENLVYRGLRDLRTCLAARGVTT